MKSLLNSFSLMRLLRLVIGVIGAGQAFITSDWLLGAAGFFLIGMAVFNIGCCGISGCGISPKNKSVAHPDAVEFEEVK